MIDCTARFQSGLPLYMNKVLSCHVCADPGQFPLIGVAGVANGWSSLSTPTNMKNVISCLTPASLVSNCGVYYELFVNSVSQGVQCGACLPSYAPTYQTASYQVTACTLIPDCL